MDKQLKHIAFYTKKVVEEGQRRKPNYIGKRLANRHDRLMTYKKMLNEFLVK